MWGIILNIISRVIVHRRALALGLWVCVCVAWDGIVQSHTHTHTYTHSNGQLVSESQHYCWAICRLQWRCHIKWHLLRRATWCGDVSGLNKLFIKLVLSAYLVVTVGCGDDIFGRGDLRYLSFICNIRLISGAFAMLMRLRMHWDYWIGWQISKFNKFFFFLVHKTDDLPSGPQFAIWLRLVLSLFLYFSLGCLEPGIDNVVSTSATTKITLNQIE